MMASKARLFGDDTALSAILASDDPREQKRLGRHVRHFNHDFWQQECESSVLRGNLAKFSQNEKMRLALVHTVPTPPRRSEPPRQIVGHRPERVRPREHKRLDSQVRHFGHDLLQKGCEHIVSRGNIATFSQKDEIRLALGHSGERRLAEACPHDQLWCTGLSACNLHAPSPDTWL